MKNFIHKSLLVALCSTAIISCKPTFTALPAPSPGSADFSKFISIGDGTAGGYADASLNRDGQMAAFPNILATQLKLVGMQGDFVQPLVEPGESYGYEDNKVCTKLQLLDSLFCDGKTELFPKHLSTASLGTIFPGNTYNILSLKIATHPPYNNLAAQGAKLIYINKIPGWFHAPKASSTAATYWQKIATTASSTMLDDALAQKPTFVSINAGAVDVMRFAKSGGGQDPAGDDDMITPQSEFHDSLYSILNALTGRGTGTALKPANPANHVKGVIPNLIDLNSFPYVTYIKWNGLILDAAGATALNTFHNHQFNFHAGANAYVIQDGSALNGKRQIKSDEFILIEIPQDSLRCHSLGAQLPIWSRWVLDAAEINIINTTVAEYNSIIKAAALAYNFAFVDANTSFHAIKTGTQFEGITLNAQLVNGNYFSLDGLNIGPLGQAAFANNCIVEINKLYGSTIPMADANQYKAVIFH